MGKMAQVCAVSWKLTQAKGTAESPRTEEATTPGAGEDAEAQEGSPAAANRQFLQPDVHRAPGARVPGQSRRRSGISRPHQALQAAVCSRCL